MTSLRSVFVLLFIIGWVISSGASAQDRYDSGPYAGFVREHPELEKVEHPSPLVVRLVKGRIYYGNSTPVAGAYFEIRDKSGHITSVVTDQNGIFVIKSALPGTYEFKVTKDEFYSAIGTLIVSTRASKAAMIRIQLQLGN